MALHRFLAGGRLAGLAGAAMLPACGGGPGDLAGPACDPARGPQIQRFADRTRESGVSFVYATRGFQGGGLAVVDLDGDDLPEIVAGRREGGLSVFRNRGAMRWQEDVDAGIDPATAATAIAAADLDNDGDRDLVIARAGTALVLANRGDGRFDEAARLEGTGTTEHVLPVDLDGDGLLDLHFGNYDLRTSAATQNRLYLNRGGLAFELAGEVGGGLTWTATALDLDGDGDQDLYIANDTLLADFGKPEPPPAVFWPPDLVLRNDGPDAQGVPRFTDIAAQVGLDEPRSSMGGLLADLDDDGRLDLYVPDFGAKKLFVREPATDPVVDLVGRFVDRAPALGLTATARTNARCVPGSEDEACLLLSWSAAASDFDLDGRDEVLIVNGESGAGDQPPVILLARGPAGGDGAEPPYREVAPEIPCLDARALVATDLDGDGDQDVAIAQREGPLVIYENRGTPRPGSWLRVALRGGAIGGVPPSNRDGIGAVVTLRMASGRTQVRAVGAGGVIHSASPAEAFFGLGGDTVERIVVQWPSGRRSEVIGPPVGATLVIAE